MFQPSTFHPQDFEATIQALVSIAWVGGPPSVEQERIVLVVSDALEVRAPPPRVEAGEALLRLRSSAAREFAVEVAHVLSYIDGECGARRRAALLELREAAGGPNAEEAIRRAERARKRIDLANVQFLRLVGHLVDMPQSAYLYAVRRLDGHKRSILRDAIGLVGREPSRVVSPPPFAGPLTEPVRLDRIDLGESPGLPAPALRSPFMVR